MTAKDLKRILETKEPNPYTDSKINYCELFMTLGIAILACITAGLIIWNS